MLTLHHGLRASSASPGFDWEMSGLAVGVAVQVSAAVRQATGLPHTQRSEPDIKKWFERADFDHSGTLSKREFLVMYVGLLADKAKVGPPCCRIFQPRWRLNQLGGCICPWYEGCRREKLGQVCV